MADGSLIFDTKVDTSGFSRGTQNLKQMVGSVQNVFKKTAAIIATTFSIRALVQFGKESINLASDVQEVQNVVDTAFGSMAYKVEAFADTCIETYGMNKLTAKQMGSTFMAMAKGIGQATDVASDKAVELTGRLGDIMSFYNKSAEEVKTIGAAIYSGETEPLKSIGIIMTETNLKTYALAKGYRKLYTQMSAAEKLLVRQEYFLEQTSMAAGDFVKTQDSWANQTRILSERWKEFKTICGNGLIRIFTPVVKVLNNMLDSLIRIGEKLSAIFGISVSSNVSEEAEAAREEIIGMGESIEEVAKQADGSTASFDDLEIIGTKAGEMSGESAAEDRREETIATKESENATNALEQSHKSLGKTVGWLGRVFEKTFTAINPILTTLQTTFNDSFGTIRSVYDEKISPMLAAFGEGFTEIGEKLLNVYNEYILPVVDYIAVRFDEFASGPLHLLIEKFGEFAGKVAECMTVIWQNFLQPFIEWFIENIAPVIQTELTNVVNVFFTLLEGVSAVVGFILDALGGVLDFITGVFTGDWEKAWNGIKEFFSGIWNGMVTVVETVVGIFEGIWDSIKKVINSILGGIESMANGVVSGINTVIRAMNNLSFDIPDWVPLLGGKTFGFNISTLKEVKIPKLATGTVVPANFGEFTAILGDNKREAEVVSPLSTMKQAIKEAVAEMGGFGGGDYTFVATLDGREIFREMVRRDRMHVKQTGESAFAT